MGPLIIIVISDLFCCWIHSPPHRTQLEAGGFSQADVRSSDCNREQTGTFNNYVSDFDENGIVFAIGLGTTIRIKSTQVIAG